MTLGSGVLTTKRPNQSRFVTGKRGLAGEVGDLRDDLEEEMRAAAAIAIEEFVDPAAADVDAIKTAFASVATPVTYSTAAELDGVVGLAEMDPPRNVTVTTGAAGTPADAPATMTVNGTGADDEVLSEVITVSQIAGEGTGTAAFKTVTSIVFPAGDGTGATLEVGFGDVFGLGRPLLSRAGLASVLREHEAGALVTTGTFSDAATEPPYGTYEPATVADAANDYALYYEWDATVIIA
jgi:hypothetical protein